MPSESERADPHCAGPVEEQGSEADDVDVLGTRRAATGSILERAVPDIGRCVEDALQMPVHPSNVEQVAGAEPVKDLDMGMSERMRVRTGTGVPCG